MRDVEKKQTKLTVTMIQSIFETEELEKKPLIVEKNMPQSIEKYVFVKN